MGTLNFLRPFCRPSVKPHAVPSAFLLRQKGIQYEPLVALLPSEVPLISEIWTLPSNFNLRRSQL